MTILNRMESGNWVSLGGGIVRGFRKGVFEPLFGSFLGRFWGPFWGPFSGPEKGPGRGFPGSVLGGVLGGVFSGFWRGFGKDRESGLFWKLPSLLPIGFGSEHSQVSSVGNLPPKLGFS